MLKRLKLKFMVMASLMLALIGFGSFNEARASSTEICPGIPFTTGVVNLSVTQSAGTSFTDGLLGTTESFSGSAIGGLDWLFSDVSFLETNRTGSQLISWWTEKNGRNTSVQVTNTNSLKGGTVIIHVQIFGPDCNEILDFDDTLSPNQTHIYDLSKLVTVGGRAIPTSALARTEGIIVITAVNAAGGSAIDFNFLQGSERITQTGDEYGTNVFARRAISQIGTCSSTTSTRCETNANCPTGETCTSTSFAPTVIGTCSTTTTKLCTVNTDCPTGETCNTTVTGAFTCDVLVGLTGCRLEIFSPTQLVGNFSLVPALVPIGTAGPTPGVTPRPGSTAGGADLVLMSIADNYGTSPTFKYLAGGGNAAYSPSLFDTTEFEQSCPRFTGCFVRNGLDDPLPISESFIAPSPSPSPSATPATPPPTPQSCFQNVDCKTPGQVCVGAVAGTCSVTKSRSCFRDAACPSGETCNEEVAGVCQVPVSSPTPRRGGGGGGGCSIGGPAEIGTAMANVLVPLVPAFAIGFRVLRRRSRKNQK